MTQSYFLLLHQNVTVLNGHSEPSAFFIRIQILMKLPMTIDMKLLHSKKRI